MRLLLIEDDAALRLPLARQLEAEGYRVDQAKDGEEGLFLAQEYPFDLAIVDLGLPKLNGLSIVQRLRKDGSTMPLLILTARSSWQDKVSGLEAGADDYLTKPFDPDELAARMRATRRRIAGRAHPSIRYGELEIDPAARTVRRAGQPVDLSAREFSILVALMEARPRVLSRGQIEAKLYNWDSTLESNAIEVHVHRLRRKLGDTLVRTVRGVGYYVPAEPAA